MSTSQNRYATILLSGLICTAGVARAEEPEAPHAASRSCLSLSHIRNSQVLDRQHILFTMSGSEMYVNDLPHPCPGLRRDTPWLHRTSLDQVCDLDVITVLNSTGGGFMPGASCGLGKFKPIGKADADALRAQLKAAKKP